MPQCRAAWRGAGSNGLRLRSYTGSRWHLGGSLCGADEVPGRRGTTGGDSPVVAFLLPLLMALLSWANRGSALHSAGISLFSSLGGVVAFVVSRDLGRRERRSLRTPSSLCSMRARFIQAARLGGWVVEKQGPLAFTRSLRFDSQPRARRGHTNSPRQRCADFLRCGPSPAGIPRDHARRLAVEGYRSPVPSLE